MSRAIALQEKTAWLNYKGYCLFVVAGNRGHASQGVFLGDVHSRHLWGRWMEWRAQLLALRKRRRR